MYLDVDGSLVFATAGGKPFDNSKPVIIFLHGSALDHTFWGLLSRFFAFRNYAVLVPDLPGHTNSQGPALTSIEAMADWLNNVVEALDANNISLVAHLPDPDFTVIEESGHMIPQEVPGVCRQLLRTFIFANNSSA